MRYGRGTCGARFRGWIAQLKPGILSEALAHLYGRRPRLKYPNCACDSDHRRGQNLKDVRHAAGLDHRQDLAVLPGGVIAPP